MAPELARRPRAGRTDSDDLITNQQLEEATMFRMQATRAVAALAMTMVLVAACGGSTASPSTSQSTAPSAAAPSATTSAAAPSPSAQTGYTGPEATIEYLIWGEST